MKETLITRHPTWQLFTLVRGHNNVCKTYKWPEASKSNDAAENGVMIEMLNKQQAMCLRCQKEKSDLNLQGIKIQMIYIKLECGLLQESNCYLRRELRQLCKSEDYTNLFQRHGTLHAE